MFGDHDFRFSWAIFCASAASAGESCRGYSRSATPCAFSSARAWLASANRNIDRVSRVVTIGSPHHGTWLARWSRVTNGRQMRQRSAWLHALAARESTMRGDDVYRKFTCFYSNADHIVFPVSTALLPGADNRHVPGVPHVALAFQPTVMRASLAMAMPAGISSETLTAS